MLLFAYCDNIYAVMLGRCFELNYWLSAVFDIFLSEFVCFRLIKYVTFVFGISIFIRLKNMKVKTGYVFFRPFSSVFRPTCSSPTHLKCSFFKKK
jgi:hypothetical protein